MRPLVPAARGSSGEPGTAINSRPCSPAKLRRHVAGDLAPRSRSIARADDGDGVRAGEGEIAQHGEQRRRRIERDEEFREVRLAAGDQARAEALGGGDLVFDGGDGGQLDAAAFSNPVCDVGQGGERMGCGAEAL